MKPIIEAHRGASHYAPENTLAAFARAIAIGVPWIELDVIPAKDGSLMVIHDESVDRTTNGTGLVAEMSLQELQQLDAGIKFYSCHKGHRIPQLVDVMRLLASSSTKLNIEIKELPSGINIAPFIVELLYCFDKQYEYIVSSFDLKCLLDIQAIDENITVAIIGDMDAILAIAEQHSFDWVHPAYESVTKANVNRAHAQNIKVNAWTVDNRESLEFLIDIGVDKVCTNKPYKMLSITKGL